MASLLLRTTGACCAFRLQCTSSLPPDPPPLAELTAFVARGGATGSLVLGTAAAEGAELAEAAEVGDDDDPPEPERDISELAGVDGEAPGVLRAKPAPAAQFEGYIPCLSFQHG